MGTPKKSEFKNQAHQLRRRSFLIFHGSWMSWLMPFFRQQLPVISWTASLLGSSAGISSMTFRLCWKTAHTRHGDPGHQEGPSWKSWTRCALRVGCRHTTRWHKKNAKLKKNLWGSKQRPTWWPTLHTYWVLSCWVTLIYTYENCPLNYSWSRNANFHLIFNHI